MFKPTLFKPTLLPPLVEWHDGDPNKEIHNH